MYRKFILLSFILIILGISSCSSSNTSTDENVQPAKIYSFCDDHPDWNLCEHKDRTDPTDLMDHENLIHSTTKKTGVVSRNRLEICKDIVKNYNETHIYEIHNYDCDDMTMDIWNQLKNEYINAKIGLGNVSYEVDNLWESSHAWVIAEYEPDKWVALEGVGGYLVNKSDNPLYFTGWFFETPLEYKKYRELVAQYNDELRDLNQLKREYNTSSFNSNDRNTKQIIIDDHEKKMKELVTKMVALSQGVKASNLNLFEN